MSELATFKKQAEALVGQLGLSQQEAARMRNVLSQAVTKNPELLSADRQSFWAAVRLCATHGLRPDDNEATLQTYKSKVKRDGREQWVMLVQYQPMIRGIIKRVLRSGEITSFYAEMVHDGEDFRIDMTQGDRRPIHEVPNWFKRSETPVGAYAVAKKLNGDIDCEPLTLDDIAKIRGVAKTQKVWDQWFAEKCKVAAMRRLSKRLPLSAEDHDMIQNSEEHELARDVTPKPVQAFSRAVAAPAPPPAQIEDVDPIAAALARTEALIEQHAGPDGGDVGEPTAPQDGEGP